MTTLRSLILGVSLISGIAAPDVRAQGWEDHLRINCNASVMVIDNAPRLVLWGHEGSGLSWYPDWNSTTLWPGVSIYPRRTLAYNSQPCAVGQWWGFSVTPSGNPDPILMQQITTTGWNGDWSQFMSAIPPLHPNPLFRFDLAPRAVDAYELNALIEQDIPWYRRPPNPCGGFRPVMWVMVCDVALY